MRGLSGQFLNKTTRTEKEREREGWGGGGGGGGGLEKERVGWGKQAVRPTVISERERERVWDGGADSQAHRR